MGGYRRSSKRQYARKTSSKIRAKTKRRNVKTTKKRAQKLSFWALLKVKILGRKTRKNTVQDEDPYQFNVLDKDLLDFPENRELYRKAKRALRKAGIRYRVGPQGGVYVRHEDLSKAEKIVDKYLQKMTW